MRPELVAVSGLGPKQAAAFVVAAEGWRLLLDLGADTGSGALPDPTAIGRVDAVLLSHAHKDHCGGLPLLGSLGDPPVYATASVLTRLSQPTVGRELPPNGRAEILGITVETGRSGHALGGVWLRLAVAGGFLYMGDCSVESTELAYDPPPPSETVILDASYNDADETRAAQVADLVRLGEAGSTLFPVPADGRGIEIALLFHRKGQSVAVDGAVRAALKRLGGADRAYARPGVAEEAAALSEAALDAADPATLADIYVASGATGDSGTAADLIRRSGDRLRVVYTGHLPEGSRGARDVAEERAAFRRWNVHPTQSQNAALVAAVGARKVVPAFGDPRRLPAWMTDLR